MGGFFQTNNLIFVIMTISPQMLKTGHNKGKILPMAAG
jgi:hypothetical protein